MYLNMLSAIYAGVLHKKEIIYYCWHKRREVTKMLAIIGDLGYDVLPDKCGNRLFLGGSGYHTAAGVIAARKNCPIIIAAVGRDFDISALSSRGIRTDYIVPLMNELTTKFFISYEHGVRNIVLEMGASKHACTERIDDQVISSHLIHLTATQPEKQMEYIRRIREMGFAGQISVNVIDLFCRESPAQVLEVLKACDIIFLSEIEKEILRISPRHYCLKHKMFILTKAEKGAECIYDSLCFRAHSKAENAVVDTTGAGDILAGAFLSLLDAGEEIQRALDLSVELATKSVQFIGSEGFFTNPAHILQSCNGQSTADLMSDNLKDR